MSTPLQDQYISRVKESIETEAVFTKTEKNRERNIHSKIKAELKKYRDWNCIYQDRNEQWMKRLFSPNTCCTEKSIETEAVFTNIEMNNEWNVYFLQIRFVLKKVSRLKLYLPR